MLESCGIELSGVAFYGFSISTNQKAKLFEVILNWFAINGNLPNVAGASGKGFSNKLTDFPVIDKKLKKTYFLTATGFELFFIPTTGTGKKYPWLEASFSTRNDGDIRLLAKSEISRVPSPSFLDCVRLISEILAPSYGIGYRRDLAQDPSGYAIGYGSEYNGENLNDEEDQLQISYWGDFAITEEHVYLKGVLRDVYPWNFLTTPQLTARVGNITLEQWICQNSQFGKLIPVTTKMLLWEANEKRIPEARRILYDARCLFDYHKYLKDVPALSQDDLLNHVLKMMGHEDPSTAIVLDGQGNEIPTEEVRKKIKGKSKSTAKQVDPKRKNKDQGK